MHRFVKTRQAFLEIRSLASARAELDLHAKGLASLEEAAVSRGFKSSIDQFGDPTSKNIVKNCSTMRLGGHHPVPCHVCSAPAPFHSTTFFPFLSVSFLSHSLLHSGHPSRNFPTAAQCISWLRPSPAFASEGLNQSGSRIDILT